MKFLSLTYYIDFMSKRYLHFPLRSLAFYTLIFFVLITYQTNVHCQTVIKDTIEQSIPEDTTIMSIIEEPFEALVKRDTAKVAGKENEAMKPPELNEIISVPNIIWTIIFLLVGYLLIKLVISILGNIARRNPRYDFTIKRLIPIIRILSWIFLIYIIIVGIYSPPAAAIFAFLASVGVAVGFASQDLLKNVFGGLVVMFDRPFQIGDKIEAGKYYGEVVEIGIRSTKVVTPDDSLVTIPNCEFMTQYVANSNSGQNNCQVVAEIYLPLNVDTNRVRQIATEAARVSKYIYLNKPVVVLFFNEIQERRSVIKMRIKAYVSDLQKEFVFKSEITELVIRELVGQKIINEDFKNVKKT